MTKPLIVLVAGPYRSGTDGDPAKIRRNLQRLERQPLQIAERGVAHPEIIEAQLHPALLVSEIRTVAADEHWLSMNYHQDSVAIHFAFYRVPEMKAALEAAEAVLRPFAPRPHWGKLFELSGAEVMSRYERLEDFRALVGRHDPNGKFRNAFVERNVFGG